MVNRLLKQEPIDIKHGQCTWQGQESALYSVCNTSTKHSSSSLMPRSCDIVNLLYDWPSVCLSAQEDFFRSTKIGS